MFYGIHCDTLDLYHFNFSKLQNYGNMFDSCDKTLIYCLDNEKISSELKANIFSYFSTSSDCSFTCDIASNTKIIIEKNVCLENCYKDINYKYEYNNNCYKSCPNNTYLSPYNDYLCLDELICINYYKLSYRMY